VIKHIILTLLFFLLANVLVWYQLNSQLVWDWAKGTKSMWWMALLGVPISLLFWWCTKIGYEAFGSLWVVRILGFSMSMLTFPIMTWIYLGEVITLKTIISIALAIIIIILQLL
tara:strand:- start:957 stop:1298 length:342 start_codon:yes stop_codon:yes gene_type:complete